MNEYPSFRAFLEDHIEESWIMRGGDFAGQERTARGLLEEDQRVAAMLPSGKSLTTDTLDLPVIEKNGVIYFKGGSMVAGFILPFDLPIMAKSWRR